MKFFYFLLLLFSVSSIAQKTKPNNIVEINLPQENESFYFLGNQRILNRTGLPTAMYQVNFKVLYNQPAQMAKQFLNANKQNLGLQQFDIDNNLKLHKVQEDATGSIVRWRQTYKGLPVNKNAEITIHISPENIVDYVMNGFRTNIDVNNIQPTINATYAKNVVESYLQITGPINYFKNELMILQNNATNYLVHHVIIAGDNPVGEWEAFVDAKTGTILKLEDIACYRHQKGGKQNVPHRTTATGTATVFDPDPLTTATAAYGGSYVDGTDANAAVLTAQLKNITLLDITLSAGVHSLVGPYAVLQDFEAPNKGLFTQASSTFNFDRNADAFEAVMCYYHIDASMRYLNTTLGVAIMPYQYTGGVRFDPSGLSGADNSHYLGGSGRLAFGEGGVDDAEDADVIIHELGHGLHDWATAGGLSQVNGLSEGSGDYWAASYSRAKGFWLPANAAYSWTFNWDGHNPFWGGRVVNYSPIYPGGLVSQIHTDGQIWATAMMKIWDDIGKQKADKAFWRGLQMTNSSTNQNDAANAVYTQAGLLGYTNAERQAIHTRFTAAGYTLPTFTLPVQLASFTATPTESAVTLQWTNLNENIGDRLVLEKSSDGITFQELYAAQAFANASVKNYSYIDQQPKDGKNYYRIKEISIAGSVHYSDIKLIQFKNKTQLHIFPNPAKDEITISSNKVFGNVVIQFIDNDGKMVMQKQWSNVNGLQQKVNVTHFHSGIYQVKISYNNKLVTKHFTKL